MKSLLTALFLFVVSLSTCKAFAPTELVIDEHHLLSATDHTALYEKVESYGDRTGMQIRLVVVDDVGTYETASAYAEVLFHSWELGDPHKHNGLLLLVTKRINSDSKNMKDYCRIMTGYGLIPVLPDSLVLHIKHTAMMPYLPESPARALGEGLDSLLVHVDQWIAGHPNNDLFTPESPKQDTGEQSDTFRTHMITFLVIVVIIIVLLLLIWAISSSGNNGGGSSSGSSGSSFVFFSSSCGGGSSSSCGSSCGGGGCGGGGCGS